MNPEFNRNPYLQHLNRIEFLVTLTCTGKCKHCSVGDRIGTSGHIDGEAAAAVVRTVRAQYPIESVMTFGGEPLLYPDVVCAIHAAARDAGVPGRQVITNGFFSLDDGKIRRVAHMLAESGVNDILLSIDAFHQETIPLAPVMSFARAVLATNTIKLRTNPAWLVDATADNRYNHHTRDLIAVFESMGIEASRGNIVFPSGNALRYLREYFDLTKPYRNEYEQDPRDIRAISLEPNGDVLGGNIHQTDILEILAQYAPTSP